MQKGTKKLIFIMTIIVAIGLVIAFIYYSDINKAEDPRILDAKLKYKHYNSLVEANDFENVLLILDSIEAIYQQFDDYKNSYEIGVVHNNRSAAFLTKAIYNTKNDSIKDSLLIISKSYSLKAIDIYINWLNKFEKLEEIQIEKYFEKIYFSDNKVFEEDQKKKYLNKRVEDIILAQRETKRRLSVSYTNIGIIFRHQLQPDSAAKYYVFALEQWDKNYIAENNLNTLLGRPIKKRNIIQKLFPSKK